MPMYTVVYTHTHNDTHAHTHAQYTCTHTHVQYTSTHTYTETIHKWQNGLGAATMFMPPSPSP